MPRPALSAAAALAVVLGAASAHAAGEQEVELSAGLSYATVKADGRTPSGPALEIDAQYGFDDAWAARLTVIGSRHAVTAKREAGLPGGHVLGLAAALGVTYTIDVLRFVPTFELAAGPLWLGGDVTRTTLDVGVQMGVGGDFYLDRRWKVGAGARYVFAPAQAFGVFPPDFGGDPWFFSFGVRLSRIF